MCFTTLLDILGATVVGGLLLLILLKMHGAVAGNSIIFGSDRSLQRSLAETALVIENDFRKMGYCEDPYKLTEGMQRILFADSASISFYTDVNRDGNLDVMSYYLGDTTELASTPNPRDRILYRQINALTPFMVSTNVTALKLEYFDVFGNLLPSPVTTPDEIAQLRISFKVEDAEAYDTLYSQAYWQQVRLTSKNLRNR
jgi:hypothetical protein